MSNSTLGYDDPASIDKNIWTDQRSVAGTNREMQIVGIGMSSWASYTATAKGVSTATSASHLLFIQADGTNYTRITSIDIQQAALAGAAATAELTLFRTSTAGSGGTAVTCRPMDTADTNPYGGTVQTLPTAKGTESDQIDIGRLGLVAAQPVDNRNRWTWQANDYEKPIIIGTGTAAGLCIKIITGIATSTVDVRLRFLVTSWL